jgi:hypothetical protein
MAIATSLAHEWMRFDATGGTSSTGRLDDAAIPTRR